MTTSGVMTTVCAFGSTNGSNPMSRLLLAGDGTFYGITAQGGLYGKGTIFRATIGGDLMSLFDFAPTNGGTLSGWTQSLPPLVQGSDGNFYGTSLATIALSSSFAVIFRLVEPPTTTVLLRPDGRLTLSWNSFPGGVYRVLYKASNEATGWATLGPDVTATGNSASCTDNPTMAAQRCYKVMLLP